MPSWQRSGPCSFLTASLPSCSALLRTSCCALTILHQCPIPHPLSSGNFNTVAIECLQKLSNPESKFTIACDRHTFNFLVYNGFSE